MTRDLISFGGKFAAVGVYFVIWWIGYTYSNDAGVLSAQVTHFTPPTVAAPFLFQPWTAIIYVLGGSAIPLLPFYYYWTWRRLATVLVSYAICSTIAVTCYLLWPVMITRPSYEGPGVGLWLMRKVLSVDNAANCTPSSHVFYAVLAALLVHQKAIHRTPRIAIWTATAAVCISTITTGQHYFVDVISGVVVALVGYRVTLMALRQSTVDSATRIDVKSDADHLNLT